MATALKSLSEYDESKIPSAEGKKFGIIISEYNNNVTFPLYEGCYNTLTKHGALEEDIHTLQVPGAFELTAGARMLAQSRKFDAVICIGCVIKGETTHNEYINNAVALGLTNLSLATGIPFIFGLLTPNTLEQALDRAGGKHGNKGVEAATTALRMVALKKELGKDNHKIGFSF